MQLQKLEQAGSIAPGLCWEWAGTPVGGAFHLPGHRAFNGCRRWSQTRGRGGAGETQAAGISQKTPVGQNVGHVQGVLWALC